VALLVVLAAATGSSASTALSQVPAPDSADPEYNFQVLWETYDQNYALFGPKRIDWDAVYRVYRPLVMPRTTDAELFDIMHRLLIHLNDNHVRLRDGTRTVRSGILNELDGTGYNEQEMSDYSISLIEKEYLVTELKSAHTLRYAWLPDSVAFLRIRGFSNAEATAAAIDRVMEEMGGARAFVIDARVNPGGDDQAGKEIASRFADTKRLYMKTYERNGPEHDDFEAARYFYAEPAGPRQFTGPIALLINRWAISAAENFALAMRVLPHATLIGDFTSGVFADVYGDELPNGWNFGVSFKLFVDPTGFCWEGIGVPPDLRIINTAADIDSGRDRVLEFAVDFLERGNPSAEAMARSDVIRASTADLRDSWAAYLVGEIQAPHGTADPRAAAEGAVQALEAIPDRYHIDLEELVEASQDVRDEGWDDAADAILWAATQAFPDAYRPWSGLGNAALAAGDSEAARAYFSEAAARNRRSYPWEKADARTAAAVIEGKRILAAEFAAAGSPEQGAPILESFRADPSHWYVEESAINSLGYRLLREDMAGMAIEVLLVNTEVFPESANAWDSLGDAYRAAGNVDAAIASYRRALGLNPGFEASRRNLEALERTQR
jgi:tetratricopeptide (TPR) repeat protein